MDIPIWPSMYRQVTSPTDFLRTYFSYTVNVLLECSFCRVLQYCHSFMRNREGKIKLQKEVYRRICVRNTTFFDYMLSFLCLFVAFFVYSLLLPKWRTCETAPMKIYRNAMGGGLCDDIMSERSEVWKSPTINNSWLVSLKTWYYFRLCFSFSCSGYDFTLTNKSHTLNCYSFLPFYICSY